MGVKCFYVEPTTDTNVYLRRYRGSESCKCVGRFGYHNAEVFIGAMPVADEAARRLECFQGDPRWPVKCQYCDYTFSDSDESQVFTDHVYTRTDTGERKGLREFQEIPGCIWNAEWLTDFEHGPDGKCLICVCPDGHDWNIDGRASNCDSPCKHCGVAYKDHKNVQGHNYEDARPHKCWVRHGTPPNLTVDKNGITCNAGAGSILTPKWHGFLRNGVLDPC